MHIVFKQRVEISTLLAKQFSEHSQRRLTFQDEKDLPPQISTNCQKIEFTFLDRKIALIVCFMKVTNSPKERW